MTATSIGKATGTTGGKTTIPWEAAVAVNGKLKATTACKENKPEGKDKQRKAVEQCANSETPQAKQRPPS